ncbi:hypothetical protein HJFPF1_09493 [Paramyrothecium foliicola]|nr:hypothetical protein HJFPF1_09493 [Paramyrothecium foliicola]
MSQLHDDVEYTTGWVAEPQQRGTMSILVTCTFTLILCVYTAVHLNIPPAGEPQRWQLLRKAKWVLIAIFAPEVVLYTAVEQFHSAWAFCRDMDQIRNKEEGYDTTRPAKKKIWWQKYLSINSGKDQQDKTAPTGPNSSQVPKPFSLIYGFYVVMGGLTADVSDMYDNVKTITLSPSRALELARAISWKHVAVSDTTINDKSKADGLAKLLVILQVSWLLLQCAARSIQGKPLTILEVHTLVHAVCAMLMYGLWFKKPLDIRDATVVGLTPDFINLVAWELINMPDQTPFTTSGLKRQYRFSYPRLKHLWHLLLKLGFCAVPESRLMDFDRARIADAQGGQFAQDYSVILESTNTSGNESSVQITSGGTQSPHDPHGNFVCTLLPGHILRCGLGPSASVINLSPIPGRPFTIEVISWSLSAKDVLRWSRAAQAFSTAEGQECTLALPQQKEGHEVTHTDNIFARAKNVRSTLPYSAIQLSGWLYLAFLVVGAAYGATHLALWNYSFPSHAEMLLWKVSACTLVALVVLLLALWTVLWAFVLIEERVDKHLREDAIWPELLRAILLICALGFILAFAILYVFARVFIVIESFSSLRMVPAGVYEGVTWADYIPHF